MSEPLASRRSKRSQRMKEDPLEDLDEMISAVSSDEDGEPDNWSTLPTQSLGQAVGSTVVESSVEETAWAAPAQPPAEETTWATPAPLPAPAQMEQTVITAPAEVATEAVMGNVAVELPAAQVIAQEVEIDTRVQVAAPTAMCPHLGLPERPDAHLPEPSLAHRCFGQERPYPVSVAQQQEYCFGPNFTACEVLVSSQRAMAAQAAKARSSGKGPLARLFRRRG